MTEQNYIPGALPPVEGRADVAGDLEEEQRNAYSSHHKGPYVSGKQSQQSQERPQEAGTLPPVEGRADVAGDLEEEQRNAYSSHHAM